MISKVIFIVFGFAFYGSELKAADQMLKLSNDSCVGYLNTTRVGKKFALKKVYEKGQWYSVNQVIQQPQIWYQFTYAQTNLWVPADCVTIQDSDKNKQTSELSPRLGFFNKIDLGFLGDFIFNYQQPPQPNDISGTCPNANPGVNCPALIWQISGRMGFHLTQVISVEGVWNLGNQRGSFYSFFGLGGLYEFFVGKLFGVPLALIPSAAITLQPTVTSANKFGLSLGGVADFGILLHFSRRLAYRLEVGIQYDPLTFASVFSGIKLTGGVVLKL